MNASTRTVAALGVAALALALAGPAGAGPNPPRGPKQPGGAAVSSASGFAVGQPQAAVAGQAGCGSNGDGEPAIHVSRGGTLLLGSERGLGGGSDLWRQPGTVGGPGVSACSLTYAGQPNATGGFGASGGDIDIAIAPAPTPTTWQASTSARSPWRTRPTTG